MATELHFRETQRFGQPWLWALLAASALLSLVALARGTRSRRTVARELVTTVGVAFLLRTARLTTEVRDDGLYLKFEPFHRAFRRVPFDEVADFEVAGYSLLRYGGWGLRWTPRRVAYTVSGRSGVMFEREDGRSLYVGSDRPDELVGAVQRATDRTL